MCKLIRAPFPVNLIIINLLSCDNVLEYSHCTEPPEEFSTKMSNEQFLLYLNANGVHYDVCKKLEGEIVVTLKYVAIIFRNIYRK
jgi:hypothetical protein